MRRDPNDLIVVCGAGGFIGGHLVASLVREGHNRVRAVDIKPLTDWHQVSASVDNLQMDLQEKEACERAVRGATWVYNLAADMGGMGFIEHNRALCMLSVLINTHLLMAARKFGTERFFFSSSACVYAAARQASEAGTRLKETDAYPAMPEDGYGWEKLFGERMCRHFREDFGVETRIARYHNVYGSVRHVDGRPREGSRGHLSQGHRRQVVRPERNRDLGIGYASAQLHVYRRLRDRN